MLSPGQSAGNVLPTTSPFVSPKRKRKRISPPAATGEVKLRNRNEQLPPWPNEVSKREISSRPPHQSLRQAPAFPATAKNHSGK